MSEYRSWGFKPPVVQVARVPAWRTDASNSVSDTPIKGVATLPYGNGRSYGDSCLNSDGDLLDTRQLNRLISFDRERGVLCAEPGMTLRDVLSVIVPAGWFLPVSPGTSYATLGGAVANDVHGKNHHADGTFGRFIESFSLSRSDGQHLLCSPAENSELYAATIGGLGLTGLITQLTFRLIPISSPSLDVRFELFHGLAEFLEISTRYKHDYQYTVAWLDCAHGGANLARGVFMAANHAASGDLNSPAIGSRVSVPMNFPAWVLNRYSIGAFNSLYYRRHRALHDRVVQQAYTTFFYPLDTIGQWNRIYGSRGFHQYQFVVPPGNEASMEGIIKRIVESGMGSFLAVLKEFGDIESPGLLSFPRPGLCLALDFANRGSRTEALIRELDNEVREAGGAAYPAKDRLMSAASFQQYFPRYQEFSRWVDPKFSSDFWRRVSV